MCHVLHSPELSRKEIKKRSGRGGSGKSTGENREINVRERTWDNQRLATSTHHDYFMKLLPLCPKYTAHAKKIHTSTY
jgi:hypothetical protein